MKARCLHCGGLAARVGGERIYPHRPDLYSLKFWLCECGAYVGSHKNTGEPLGNPCDMATKIARIKAHAHLDSFWRSGKLTRKKAYKKLSEFMNLPKEDTHIGMFTKEQCERVLEFKL